MNEYFLSYNQLYVIVLVGVVVGALLGLIPLMLGRKRNRARLGLYGFFASIVAGALSPIVAVVVVAIFSWVIVKGNTTPSADSDGANNSPSVDSTSE